MKRERENTDNDDDDILIYNNHRVLEKAVKEQDVEAVRTVLATTTRVRPDWVILTAVRRRNVDIVRALLVDARFEVRGLRGTIYTFSIDGPNAVEMIRVIMEDARFDPSCYENSPVAYAAKHDHIDALRVLLEHPRVNPLDALARASSRCAHFLATHSVWGIGAHRQTYVTYRPGIVRKYDTMIAPCLAMAWFAEQVWIWRDMVQPMTERWRVGFFE